jgi:uncharacterized protein (TIGR03118 family)
MNLERLIAKKITTASAAGAVCVVLSACGGGGGDSNAPAASNTLADTALVSNRTGVVATNSTIDANLSNPWGLVSAPGLPFWIADNNSNLATLYSGTGQVATGTVTGSNTAGIEIPASAAGVPANPTGQVFNAAGGFAIATPMGQESAMFIFAGEGGTIAAWAKDSGTHAVTAYDDGVSSGDNHAVYKGLAMGSSNGANFLYATDLHNGKVDVFDTHFEKPDGMQGKFVDPTLPAGYVPFGIAALNNQLFVTYAKQDAQRHDETTGAGLGYIDIFDFNGEFVGRLASGGDLNAPWGLVVAPAGFGTFQGDLLVGNFGDGAINVFAPNGNSLATSMGPLTVNGNALAIPGLWALAFGNGDADKPKTTLFYTAGFANQTDGVFGGLAVAQAPTPNPY